MSVDGTLEVTGTLTVTDSNTGEFSMQAQAGSYGITTIKMASRRDLKIFNNLTGADQPRKE